MTSNALQWLAQDDERRRLEVEARQEKEKREEQNRRKEHDRTEEQRENDEKQGRRKKAFVMCVKHRSGGVIGLINNTGRSITFKSTRFLMKRSQVLVMRKIGYETNKFLSGGRCSRDGDGGVGLQEWRDPQFNWTS